MQNVDTGNSLRENVTTGCNRAERGKLLKGQIHHFLNTAVIQIITESGARTRVHSKSWRETERASCVNFARSAGLAKAFGVGVRCLLPMLLSTGFWGTQLKRSGSSFQTRQNLTSISKKALCGRF